MKRLIRGFDCFLRWALGVFEFCRAPDCLLRVRRMSLTHPVTLAGETFGAGTPAIAAAVPTPCPMTMQWVCTRTEECPS